MKNKILIDKNLSVIVAIHPGSHHLPIRSPINETTKPTEPVSWATRRKQSIMASKVLLPIDVKTASMTMNATHLPAMEQKKGNLDTLDYMIRGRPHMISTSMATEYPEMIDDNMSSKATTMRETTISTILLAADLTTHSGGNTRSSPPTAIISCYDPPDDILSP
jgi:hypothetical protein